jgi:hypothetical protein
MAEDTCEKADCTIATTGKCLLSHHIPAECPHFRSGALSTEGVKASNDIALAVVPDKPIARVAQIGRKFHCGIELGTQDAIDIMRARYGHLIGVLGSAAAGKTCFLSSLYLIASGGMLPRTYQFAGSLTLQAFEDRVRGLREWQNGRLPDQLVDHTILSDMRRPSLLHLAIRESQKDRRRFDLLLTDLPGEWTDKLVKNATNAQSFRFLHRADGIILVVDGNQLGSDQRHVELQHMRYFTDRIANNVGIDRSTPFVIVISKGDKIDMQMPPAANELKDHVKRLGFPTTLILSAAFSRRPDDFKSGTGVFDAVAAIISHPVSNNLESPDQVRQPNMRAFQAFRG